MQRVYSFVGSLISFILLDLIWFKLISGDFFYQSLKPIARAKDDAFDIDYLSGFIVYLLLSLGVHILVLSKGQDMKQTLFKGACFGFLSYGIYDFTNHATLAHWPASMMAVDIAWGTFSCFTVTYITTRLSRS